MDEAKLANVILANVDNLTCFSCGEKLVDCYTPEAFDKLRTIHFDKGSKNYPHEPDEPASIYFECMRCSENGI